MKAETQLWVPLTLRAQCYCTWYPDATAVCLTQGRFLLMKKYSWNNSPYSTAARAVPETTQEGKETEKKRRSQSLENKESNILLKKRPPTK